jgi:hypothetical protein
VLCALITEFTYVAKSANAPSASSASISASTSSFGSPDIIYYGFKPPLAEVTRDSASIKMGQELANILRNFRSKARVVNLSTLYMVRNNE